MRAVQAAVSRLWSAASDAAVVERHDTWVVRRLSEVCTEDGGARSADVELSSGSKECCSFSSRCADSVASLHQDGGAQSADVKDRSLAVATAFFDRRVYVEAARHHLAAVAKKGSD